MKLRHKINLLIISLSLLIVLLPVLLHYHSSRVMLKQQLDNYMNAELGKQVSQIEGWLKTQEQIVLTTSDIIENYYKKEEITQDLIASNSENEDISDMYIGFNDGSIISAKGWIPTLDYDPRQRPWYKDAIEAGKLKVSTVYLDLLSNENAVSICVPIRDNTNHFIGVLGADILMRTVNEKIKQIDMDGMGYAYLVDTKGNVLVHQNAELIGKNVEELVNEDFKESLIETESGAQEYTYQGKNKFAVFSSIEGTGWKLAVIIQEDLAYKPLHQLKFEYSIIAIITLIISFMVSQLLTRNLSRRIRYLSEVSNSLIAGDFSIQIKNQGKDEIGEVTSAFSTMKNEIELTISKLNVSKQKYERIASFDTLTNLPNRFKLMEDMEQRIDRCRKTEEKFAVAYIDLDHFKNVNDTLGYAMGDFMLQKIGVLLSKEYCAYRIGADEFAVLLKDKQQAVADQIEKISSLLNQKLDLNYHMVYNSVAIGVVIYPEHFGDVYEMMIRGDESLNWAKKTNPSGVMYYDNQISKELDHRIKMEAGIRNALENKEFLLYYQPLIESYSGQIEGFEALIRWKNKDGKMVYPADFIPVAEHMDIIHELGLWTIEQALTDLAYFQKKYNRHFTMAINVSANQLKRDSFTSEAIQRIKESNISPKYIEFEITESVLIESLDIAKSHIKTLTDFGVGISLDDFGTGYSSLSYLQSFPINKLKIDKSFVDFIKEDTNKASLIPHMITIAHSCQMKTVAEGVETLYQKKYLRDHFCDFFQGYYFYKPMPREELEIHLISLSQE